MESAVSSFTWLSFFPFRKYNFKYKEENNHGESDRPVNFGGVTFFPEDYIYADLTGIILSQEALDLGDFEEE